MSYRNHPPRQNIEDKDILLIIAFICPSIYYATSVIFINSQVPLLIAVFLGCNMFSRTKIFSSLLERVEPQVSKLFTSAPSTSIDGLLRNGTTPGSIGSSGDLSAVAEKRLKFEALSESSKLELISAIKSLQSYTSNSKTSNERHKKLFKMMSWRQQKLCEDVGYLKRLIKVDQAILKNQVVLSEVANHGIESYGLGFQDFDMLKQNSKANSNSSSSNYRVIEALGHFIRDWSDEGTKELDFLIKNVKQELNRIIPIKERAKTCVVIPGSGLGRIAHEVAVMGETGEEKFGSVQAVEYSGLMQLCNSFVYNKSTSERDFSIFPFIHTSSNFVKSSSQFRALKLNLPQSKPANLGINHDDFRYFEIPEVEKYDNVVVLSIFFMDTAENIVEYLDSIQSLTSSKTSSIKRGFWVNIGPLKYGSAAQAELTAEELAKVRENMGWKDLNYVNTIEDPAKYGENGVVGYITDKESMWQGYYGLSMWTSERRENKKN